MCRALALKKEEVAIKGSILEGVDTETIRDDYLNMKQSLSDRVNELQLSRCHETLLVKEFHDRKAKYMAFREAITRSTKKRFNMYMKKLGHKGGCKIDHKSQEIKFQVLNMMT